MSELDRLYTCKICNSKTTGADYCCLCTPANSTESMEGTARKAVEDDSIEPPSEQEKYPMEQMVEKARTPLNERLAAAKPGDKVAATTEEMEEMKLGPWGLEPHQLPQPLLENQEVIRTAKILAVETILKLLDVSDEENEIAVSIVKAYGFGLEGK